MTGATPTLAGAFRDMEAATVELELTSRSAGQAPLPAFRELIKVAASLDTAGRTRSPVGIDRFVEEWRSCISGTGHEISVRALRALCWHPDTSLQAPFLRCVKRRAEEINGRALEGLVRSCFALWSRADESGAAAVAARLVAEYGGRRRTLVLWKEAGLLPRGVAVLEDAMARQGADPERCREKWHLAAGDEFLQVAVSHACEACLDADGEHAIVMVEKLLPWRDFDIARFQSQFSAAVQSQAANRADGFRESLLRLVRTDDRLGDPRISWNQPRWAALRVAERRVVEWLSQLDIQFFFEHVLPVRSDRHGRKKFWLQYVHSVRRTRPLLCDDDRDRLRWSLADDSTAASGRIRGYGSAFLLDFGGLLVVEFAKHGNACYIYESDAAGRVVAEFWSREPFSPALIKRKELSVARITHYPPGQWQDRVARILASHGIRP